jgi:hypothetical protein
MAIRMVLASAVLLAFDLSMSLATPVPPPSELSKLEQARLKAARKAWEALTLERKRMPADWARPYILSKRLLKAERAVARGKEERVAAFQHHLDRMTAIKKEAESIFRPYDPDRGAPSGISYIDLAEMEFYCAEAELWLARAKKSR